METRSVETSPFSASCRGVSPAVGFVRLLWRAPLWSLPFALVFGTVFGPWTLEGYWLAFKISLVFSYCIGGALWAFETFVIPRIGVPSYRGGTAPNWVEPAGYVVSAVLGGYGAALLNHAFIMPGFLGSPRAVLISLFFTLLFSGLFTGIAYAMVFYRRSIEQARRAEATRAELARAELRALRAQVHPHFLFNTLNSIASLIAVNPAAAEDTTTRLADIFRYTLTASSRERARLGDEIQFLRDLLAIERLRFGERLRVDERVAPETAGLLVPSLILQPLVENAVKYAVNERPEGGRVRLAASIQSDRLVLEVADDGPGMNGSRASSGTGFGLESVRERLRAAGHEDALTIESAPGRGTCIRIRLPLDACRPPAAPSHP